MNRLHLSMRAKLTLLVTIVAAVLAVSAVMFGTARVRSSIVADLLDSNADQQFDDIDSSAFTTVDSGPVGTSGPSDVAYGPRFEAEDARAAVSDLDEAGLYQPLASRAGVDSSEGITVMGSFGRLLRVSPAHAEVLDVSIENAGPVISLFSIYDLSFLTVDAEALILSERFDPAFAQSSLPEPVGPDLSKAKSITLATGLRDRSGITILTWADTSDVQRSVDRFKSVLWLVTPLALLGAALTTWMLAGRALRPVVEIADRASRISGGNLHERVPEPGTGDEIDHLAVTVNAMLARLENDDTARRRFVSDASHELRSPVAVLRSQAEVAMKSPGEVVVTDYAADVAAESERLGRIVDDMLVLARGDEARGATAMGGMAPGRGTEIDLDDIVLNEAQRTRSNPVDTSAVSATKVPGPSDTWERIVRHLLDNAARHATSRVWVGVRSDMGTGGHPVSTLWVDDDGTGIAPADRGAVFERFTRLDEARTRDRGGAGLGLAVVAESVANLGGTVEVTDSPAGGARFVVTIPTTTPPP